MSGILESISEIIRTRVIPLVASIIDALRIRECCETLLGFLAIAFGNLRGGESVHRLLMVTAGLNFILLWSAWSLWAMPTMGFGIGLGAWLSAATTAFVWMTITKHPLLSRVQESFSMQFLMGLLAGTTFMAGMLSLIMAVYFGNVLKYCNKPGQEPTVYDEYECFSGHRKAMRFVSFLETLLFFSYAGLTGTIVMNGGENLGSDFPSHQYENIDANNLTPSAPMSV